jgi:phosphatidyl-myo-inositol dimannoside synthase
MNSQKPRICMVSPCLHGRQYGGVQRSGGSAWDAVSASSHFRERSLLCYGTECDVRGHSTERFCSGSKWTALLQAVRLRGRSDVVLVWHLGMLKLAPLVRRAGARVFLYLHGVECWRTMDPSARKLAGSVDCFLSNSDFTWKRFIEHNGSLAGSQHQTVALGLDVSPSSARKPDQRPIALMVGRMDRGEAYKGHASMIQAWPLVVRNIPDAELWIAGGGDLKVDLEEMAHRTGVAGSIRFFGQVSERQKSDFLQQSRCLTMPSRGEGFGLVYLEAMRIGRPCLVSTVDAGREVVNPPEAGLDADPDDVEAICAAMCRLLSEGTEWDRWSASARQRYERHYTGQAFQDRLIEAITARVPA